MLFEILNLVPTSPTLLVPLIVSSFPHRRFPSAELQHFVKNMLQIATHCVALRPQIYVACVSLLLGLDVEIRVDEDEENIINASSQPLEQLSRANGVATQYSTITTTTTTTMTSSMKLHQRQSLGEDDSVLQFDFDGHTAITSVGGATSTMAATNAQSATVPLSAAAAGLLGGAGRFFCVADIKWRDALLCCCCCCFLISIDRA